MSTHNDVKLKKMTYNGSKIKKWVHDGTKVFSAGNVVTYYVDATVFYKEEVDSDAGCLSPKTFTPSLSGWTFVGWREDTAASASVLSSKVMGDEPVTLYAVFKKNVTLSYNGNGSTSGTVASQTGTSYYNCGNTANPTFTIAANGFTRTDYEFLGWTLGSTSGASYAAGDKIILSSNATLYAAWEVTSLVVYDATYSYVSNVYLTLDSENVKNTDYIKTATEYEVKAERGTSPPYSAGGTGTVLALTEQAAEDFAYAEVVLYVHGYVNYGDVSVSVNGNTVISSGYVSINKQEEKTITLDLDTQTAVTAAISALNRSSNVYYMVFGEVAVKSVRLYK